MKWMLLSVEWMEENHSSPLLLLGHGVVATG